MAQGRLARVTSYMHGHLCVVWWLFSSPVSFFLSFPLLFFQTFQTPFSAFHKKFMSKDLRDFRLGTVASNDHETPLTCSTWWNWQGSWCSVFLQFRKSRRRRAKSKMNGEIRYLVFWRKPPKMAFKNAIYCVADGSFTADVGLL